MPGGSRRHPAGAKEYIPLPPDPELIAAVLEAVSREKSDFVFRDPSMERVVKLALQVAGSEALGADCRRERRRQGGDGPLPPAEIEAQAPTLRLRELRRDP